MKIHVFKNEKKKKRYFQNNTAFASYFCIFDCEKNSVKKIIFHFLLNEMNGKYIQVNMHNFNLPVA